MKSEFLILFLLTSTKYMNLDSRSTEILVPKRAYRQTLKSCQNMLSASTPSSSVDAGPNPEIRGCTLINSKTRR